MPYSKKYQESRTSGLFKTPEVRARDYARNVLKGKYLKEGLFNLSDTLNRVTAAQTPEQKRQAYPGLLDYFGAGIIGGKLAKYADLDLLKVAQDAEAGGMSKQKIFDATGWWKGADDQWRFEIDDNASTFNQPLFNDALRENIKPMSSRLFESDEFLKNYPGNSYRVTAKKAQTGAAFYERPAGIELGAWGGGRSSMAHELQHSVQAREGFARGGSARAIQKEVETLESTISALNKRIRANVLRRNDIVQKKGEYKDMSPERRTRLRKNLEEVYEELQDAKIKYIKEILPLS